MASDFLTPMPDRSSHLLWNEEFVDRTASAPEYRTGCLSPAPSASPAPVDLDEEMVKPIPRKIESPIAVDNQIIHSFGDIYAEEFVDCATTGSVRTAQMLIAKDLVGLIEAKQFGSVIRLLSSVKVEVLFGINREYLDSIDWRGGIMKAHECDARMAKILSEHVRLFYGCPAGVVFNFDELLGRAIDEGHIPAVQWIIIDLEYEPRAFSWDIIQNKLAKLGNSIAFNTFIVRRAVRDKVPIQNWDLHTSLYMSLIHHQCAVSELLVSLMNRAGVGISESEYGVGRGIIGALPESHGKKRLSSMFDARATKLMQMTRK